MIPKKGESGKFFPVMKWNSDFLLGLRDVGGGFAGRKPHKRPRVMDQNRVAMQMMKRTRRRLARFLPRHGRLMVR